VVVLAAVVVVDCAQQQWWWLVLDTKMVCLGVLGLISKVTLSQLG
jgi:uncharacterized membrane-anchored protein